MFDLLAFFYNINSLCGVFSEFCRRVIPAGYLSLKKRPASFTV
jgi:hypothetical protein